MLLFKEYQQLAQKEQRRNDISKEIVLRCSCNRHDTQGTWLPSASGEQRNRTPIGD